MTHAGTAGHPDNDLMEGTSSSFTRKQFWGLMAMSAVAYFATSYLTQLVGFFTEPGFNSSMLMDGRRIVLILTTAIWVPIVGIAMTMLGKRIRPDAGLFAAAAAFWALRRSGGMARDVYLDHPAASTLRLLAVELLIIGAIVGVIFVVARKLVSCKTIPDDADLDLIRPQSEPFGQRMLAMGTQALVMMVLMLLTLRSDERMQVTGMVFVSSLLAAICTVRFIPATPSVYFWAGPFVVGIFGYLVSSVRGTANLPIGEVAGYFGALARAMPLDYASAGVAGSLYGYWIGRGWIPEDALEPEKA